MNDTSTRMGKEDRKRRILRFLYEHDLALPPKAVYTNLKMQGATFSENTVGRLLRELHEEEYVSKVRDEGGYYQITSEGREFLDSES